MHRYAQLRALLAYAIAGLAGFVDATGFLAANGYYVSFMSGNSTQLGVDLATAPRRALAPAGLIAGFVLGVTLGALLGDWAGERRKSAVTAFAGLLLACAAVSQQLGSSGGFLAFTVVAMGVLNNSFRQGGGGLVGVTYMTGALVRFGQGLAARLRGAGTPGDGWLAQGALWLSLAVGALGGAAIFSALPNWSGWVALGLAGIIVLMALAIERGTCIAQSS
jgi:uncharacterized membrane protein YoaK (UPF0700 family)